jgi:hypothetical protein
VTSFDDWGLPRSTGEIDADDRPLSSPSAPRTNAQRAAVAVRLADIRAREVCDAKSHRAVCQVLEVTSSDMADQSLSEQAREAVLKAIIKAAPTVGNSPAGIRDLAEAYALLERELIPNAGVVQNKT